MSTKTMNYNLHKIELNDAPPDITVLNQNWDIIDEELKKKYDVNNKPTAADVGALPIAGGKDNALTGSLYVNGGYATLFSGNTSATIAHFPDKTDTTNGMLLEVKGSGSSFNKAINLLKRVNGSETTYSVYGEHNITKGTTDIGANSTLATGCIHLVYE